MILGCDLSYTSTGLVLLDDGEVVEWWNPRTTNAWERERRTNFISNSVIAAVDKYLPDLVVIEDYAFNKVQGATMLGELGGVVKHDLWLEQRPFAVVQSLRAKAEAGSGKFGKQEMIDAAQAVWPECPSVSDVADAYWLARYAASHWDEFWAA